MTLAIDASTPAIAVSTNNGITTVTSASFSPPAGSLLYIRWAWNTGAANTPAAPSIADNLGTPLTYTLLDHHSRADSPAVDGQCAQWSAVVGTSAAMTVTVTAGTGTTVHGGALHVTVLTGQHATPIGAHGKASSTSAASIAYSYTAQATSGWGFIGVTDWDLKGAETAGTGCTLTNGGSGNAGTEISYGVVRRTAADDSNGSSNTLNVTLPGTSTNLSWVYAEIVPAATVTSTGAPPLVVTSTWAAPIPRVILSASQPLGNPAVGTPSPIVVGPVPTIPLVPGARIFAPTATAVTPNVTVVTPAHRPVTPPPVSISVSQPLGNPATPTPGPLVISTPWTAKVPGAILSSNPAAPIISTTGTPAPLVVGPPFTPVPVPLAYITASQPLGNPAVGTPAPLVPPMPPMPAVLPRPFVSVGAVTTSTGMPLVVVPAFTLAPVPGARVFAAPAAPAATAVPTAGPIVVTPPWQPVPIPRTILTASYPLGRPAVASPQPLVVTPPHRWPVWTASLAGRTPILKTSCSTARPNTGTTSRPASGTTARPGSGTTVRPTSGLTTRPNTGITPRPCG